MKYHFLAALAAQALCGTAYAAGCDDYPFTQGINVEDVNGGTKIISTAIVSVSTDDVDSVKDAREEATIEAKTLITAWMEEAVKNKTVIDKAVNETKSMQGDNKVVTRNEVTTRVKNLFNATQGVLRGVVPLAECYTKGKELRVSVGMKPETIAAAEKAAGLVSRSLTSQPTPNGGPASNSSSGNTASGSGTGQGATPPGTTNTQKTNPVDGYSNTDRLKKF